MQTPLPETFAQAHERTLPRRLDEGLAADAARAAAGLPTLALRIENGRAFSYRPTSDSVAIEAGDEGAAIVVEIEERDWAGWWNASEALFGLLLAGRLRVVTGDPAIFTNWETALRVLYEGLPAHDPEAPLVDRHGQSIDPTAAFHPDDDPDRLADFLRVTGYLLVREVFSATEVIELREASTRLRETVTESDRHSWWSQDEGGRSRLTRVLNGETEAPIAALPNDPRVLAIVALSDHDLEPSPSNAVSVLYKQSGLVFDGKADQPWHRDCGLGGHALMCPLMNASVFLDTATRESGELRFLPGSWRTAGCAIESADWDRGVAIDAGPGDFSLHYGDGLHAGTPPTSKTGPFRRSLVFEYGPRGRTAEQSQDHYDQLMHEVDAKGLHGR